MHPPSPEKLREIYDEHGGDLEAVAAVLGVDLPEHVIPTPIPLPSRRQPPADLGKAELRQYIVSKRHADHAAWPKEDEAKIEDARAAYEAGTHEMCQGRDRNWFVLYLIPRQKRAGARKFFRTHD